MTTPPAELVKPPTTIRTLILSHFSNLAQMTAKTGESREIAIASPTGNRTLASKKSTNPMLPAKLINRQNFQMSRGPSTSVRPLSLKANKHSIVHRMLLKHKGSKTDISPANNFMRTPSSEYAACERTMPTDPLLWKNLSQK